MDVLSLRTSMHSYGGRSPSRASIQIFIICYMHSNTLFVLVRLSDEGI